ncbi:ribosomal RNA small subunit methyltransferase B [Collibacillus ludicampi]|uniref:16S rRNA (cytosine(967)-C(5))-methyltransferase n=1 Tax=Collibacillus ludicampi TaxID=2771369 RepID=A0AAV4LJE5_9BACL|nr:16S rRNA (cytosine(967)-C(5))-methyltransferase RsmB [Collibacillus ludicampi]GIM47529.1 ribosomal RNA small subunit methyltransferase B [Collibacillus ludicampi]
MKTVREVALDVLLSIETQDAYSNLALQNALRKNRFTPQDTALCTEIVYGTVQRLNTIDAYIRPRSKQPLERLEPWVRNLLRLTVYQLKWLDRVPAFAAIHEAVEIAKRRNPRAAGFLNAVLRAVQRQPDLKVPSPEDDPVRYLSIVHSHPDWLVRSWIRSYGFAETKAMCEANNGRPSLSLRANRCRITTDELLDILLKEGFNAKASLVSPDGVVLQNGGDVTKLRAFREGYCTVQDESSMLVAPFLAPKPGMRILDACAAPGGKTTHLAEQMGDEGEVVATDIHQHKVELIRTAAKRLGLTSIRALAGDIREQISQLGKFDAILLDAPCSGFGVIRRKPDLKWKKKPSDVRAIRKIQQELLRTVADSLHTGGILVYSTCTVGPEENIDVIREFLQERDDFQIDAPEPYLPAHVCQRARIAERTVQILPHDFGSDGFFMVRLRKM